MRIEEGRSNTRNFAPPVTERRQPVRERGPALLDNRSLRSRSEKQIHDVIQNGKSGGMPAFALPEDQLQPLARWVRSLNVSAYDLGTPGDVRRRRTILLWEGPVRVVSYGERAGRGERAGSSPASDAS